MKFLCVECDEQMQFEERQVPGDGTFAAAFRCPKCNRKVAMLANPMETQLVSALGVKVGGRTIDEQPLEMVRSNVMGKEDAFVDGGSGERGTGSRPGRPTWSAEAKDRLSRVPNFVRGMVMKIYGEYAEERGISEITPDVMDRARTELGLEQM